MVLKVFHENFNLSFGQSRSDTCGTCDRLKILIDVAETEEEKQKAMTEQELHHRRAEKGQPNMKEDSERSRRMKDTLVVSFDMQQQLFLPQLTHSQMFYSRQYEVWNFGVHVENKNVGIMTIWPETCGGRGSVEVASCFV